MRCGPQEAGASLEDVLGAIKASPWVLGLDLEKHGRPTLDLLALYGFQQQQVQQQQQAVQ